MIFLDPPYQHNLIKPCLEAIARGNLLRESGTLVVEHSAREHPEAEYGSLILNDQRKYGDTWLSFFKHKAAWWTPRR
jgi:16S rRNA G966 N2-methylase RsmD